MPRRPGTPDFDRRPNSFRFGLGLGLVAVALLLAAGCRSPQPPQPPQPKTATGAQSASGAKSWPLRGKVVSIDPQRGEVTVDHQAVPGFMEAMTMPYKVKDRNVLAELHPGDRISADIVEGPDDYVLDHIVVVQQARPDARPAAAYHVPEPGDAVPDFTLVNEEGRTIHLDQFHGKALLVTFIYTRCPFADFCPRVSGQFVALNRSLADDPALRDRTQLLSISFDPAHDTPAVLKRYGAAWSGQGDAKHPSFAHWQFAVARPNELPALAHWFDLGYSEENGQIVHTLITTVIGPDGRVVKLYPGNEWTANDLMRDLQQIFPGRS